MFEPHFTFSSPQAGAYTCEPAGGTDGVLFYRIAMRWPEKGSPQTATLRFSFPGTDTYSVFDCRRADRAKSWGGAERTARLAADLPLLQLISKTGENRVLLTLSDVKTPTKIRVSCNYRQMTCEAEIAFFTELTAPADSFSCLLRADLRAVPFYAALADARRWFASLGYAPAHTPAAALEPVYSTWYSYTTEITAADVLRECRAAKGLGMETVIIDDGWQRQNGASFYGYTGDWKPYPEKFPDMAGLVRELHALGMKVLLWYAVPFVGHFSDNYARFRGKYLREVEDCDCAVLDPRYPEVRAFLVETYTQAAAAWELDGFKLDFIDRFRSDGAVRPGMDFVSVEDATHQLLSEIYAALTAVRPDMLIEFRQPYAGPVISAFGNMIRVWDCPNDGQTNRLQTLNLRLTTDAAVHADMIRWHSDETPEQVAALLWGTAFSVPQISVRFDEVTPAQLAVLRRYLDFWRAHRETLLCGALTVQSPECLDGLVCAAAAGEAFLLCTAQNFADVSAFDQAYVCNLTQQPRMAILARKGMRLRVTDCAGSCVFEGTADGDLSLLAVPTGGVAQIGG